MRPPLIVAVVISLITAAIELWLWWSGYVTDPLLAFGVLSIAPAACVLYAFADRAWSASSQGKMPKAWYRRIGVISYEVVVPLGALAVYVVFCIKVSDRLLHLNAPVPPARFQENSILFETHARLKDTGLYPVLTTIPQSSPDARALAEMNKFLDDYEAGATPGFSSQRLIFAVSSPNFAPPYRTMTGRVTVPSLDVIGGQAFMVSTQGDHSPPVRVLRHMPLRFDTTANGAPNSFTNHLTIISP